MMQLTSLDEGQAYPRSRLAGSTQAPCPPQHPRSVRCSVAAATPGATRGHSALRALHQHQLRRAAPRAPSPASARPLAQAPPAASDARRPTCPCPRCAIVPPNGLAATPLMGWSSRQKLGSRTDDAAIRQAVEGLVESGLHLVGYVYVEIGDGWQGARDAQGVLHPNERFPDMKALGDYIHSQGLKFGLTASAAARELQRLRRQLWPRGARRAHLRGMGRRLCRLRMVRRGDDLLRRRPKCRPRSRRWATRCARAAAT